MTNILYEIEVIKRRKILNDSYEVCICIAITTTLKVLHSLPNDIGEEELEKRIGMSIEDAYRLQ